MCSSSQPSAQVCHLACPLKSSAITTPDNACTFSLRHTCQPAETDFDESRQQPPKAQPKQAGPTISLLAKELQAQWQKERNRHLGNRVIRPYSSHKVWWSCDQCPDSLPHVWEAIVNSRTQGAGCPFCSGQALCQHNTLARKAPQVAKLWDANKNFPLLPDQVSVFSSTRAHWKCGVCLHEWQAGVFVKTVSNSECPKCAEANGGKKTDGTRQKHSTFATAKHALLEQWDHDRNAQSGNFPDNTKLKSNKLIWWHCHKCPKGKVHIWHARPAERNSVRRATGCPFCVGHKLCECNSLETVCPDIAADFDSYRNGVSAAEVTNSSSTKYSWLSDKPGAKQRSVFQRTAYTKRKAGTSSRRS